MVVRAAGIPSSDAAEGGKTQHRYKRSPRRSEAGGSVLAIIETALGLKNVDAVAAARRCSAPRVRHAGLRRRPQAVGRRSRPHLPRRRRFRFASRCAGIGFAGRRGDANHRRRNAPPRRPCVRARVRLRREAVHSSQAGRRRFARPSSPTAAEVDWARRVIAAVEGRRRRGRRSTARWSTGPGLLEAQSIIALATP